MTWLSRCEFDEIVTLEGTARLVVFRSCRLPGLNAGGLRVERQLSLCASHVDGAVRLAGANVNGELDLSHSRLHGEDGVALAAARLVVAGNLPARELDADGRIDLSGADIAGTLDLSDAHVRDPGGQAVAAGRISVGDHLNFTGFTSEGQVMLRGAQIDGQVLFTGAHLANPGRYARHASAVTVGDSLYLWRGFTVLDEGSYLYPGNHLGGRPDQWPSRVSLDGLVYETLDPQLPAEQRLEWLRRDADGYDPQPYEQLSAAYRRLGHDADARRVLLAKQRRRRDMLGHTARFWGYLQDWTVGYGYQPGRAVAWLLALLIIGTVVFSVSPPSPLKMGEAPHFNAFIYTLDLLLPIVGFGQQGAWNPAGTDQWLAYLLIAAGWLLATCVAAGVTRALTRN